MIKKIVDTIYQNGPVIKFTTGILVSSLCVSYMMYDTHTNIIRKKEIEIQNEYNKRMIDLINAIKDNKDISSYEDNFKMNESNDLKRN
jgi:hypothetical protein